MPSVVVLIPANDGDFAPTHSALTSPSKQTFISHRTSAPSTSHSSSFSSFSSSHSSSSPSKSNPSLVTLSTRIPVQSGTSQSPRPLFASSSSSSPTHAFPLLHQPSNSSSTSTSSTTSHRSRSSHHHRSVDLADPFGSDAYNSAKRYPATGQGLYTCQWRLRDKKGVLDPNGHQFCDVQLMTADLLAKHVLTQHSSFDSHVPNYAVQCKVACKWGGCFNRHYDTPGLAAHLVHDHFTQQMGLKYACIAKQCPIKTILTSHNALERHQFQYHSGPTLLRPVWQPQRALQNNERTSQLLALFKKLDTAGPSIPKMPVSDSANPKRDRITAKVRLAREAELKRRCFDSLEVRPGQGQIGEPWIRFHNRGRKFIEYEASLQAAENAIFHATIFDQDDLDTLRQAGDVCIELEGDATFRAIEWGLERAQLYDRPDSSPHQQRRPLHTSRLTLPTDIQCAIPVTEAPPEHLFERIGAASLAAIENEMRFDAALSKQRRWANKVLKIGPAGAKNGTATSTPDLDDQSDDDSDDWAPPLRLEPHHPSSRSKFAVDEDATCHEVPRAIRRRTDMEAETEFQVSSWPAKSSSLTSPIERSFSLTPISRLESVEPPIASSRIKREFQVDGDTALTNGSEPPTSRMKIKDKKTSYIDLTDPTADSVEETKTPPPKPSIPPMHDELQACHPLPLSNLSQTFAPRQA
ncbi:uncharacterized protein MEPE_01239 [Melanopsichium pennsylvanicum]|uniref:Uncharacterized protein n=2 Tax=Melanopsichium pennsylvanicum TaxID=63383 RepID=A0AAJ4XI37_9BASI|nr:hypothetical protein BN887_01024 [Melanopsichium pennsylvanicum 4]SNX82533.1 uncharacterized protein MEPE_01239 [Melanopsichium pennsylvanicum]